MDHTQAIQTNLAPSRRSPRPLKQCKSPPSVYISLQMHLPYTTPHSPDHLRNAPPNPGPLSDLSLPTLDLQLQPLTPTPTQHRTMSSFTPDLQGPTPPILPPKPGSHDTSRIATPHSAGLPPPPPLTDAPAVESPASVPDPGDQWLPKMLQDKSFVHFSPSSKQPLEG